MFEDATIKISYKDFKEIEKKLESLEETEKENAILVKDLEENKPAKTLDKMLDVLKEGYKNKTAKKKQEAILKCIELYGECFDIPLDIILEN